MSLDRDHFRNSVDYYQAAINKLGFRGFGGRVVDTSAASLEQLEQMPGYDRGLPTENAKLAGVVAVMRARIDRAPEGELRKVEAEIKQRRAKLHLSGEQLSAINSANGRHASRDAAFNERRRVAKQAMPDSRLRDATEHAGLGTCEAEIPEPTPRGQRGTARQRSKFTDKQCTEWYEDARKYLHGKQSAYAPVNADVASPVGAAAAFTVTAGLAKADEYKRLLSDLNTLNAFGASQQAQEQQGTDDQHERVEDLLRTTGQHIRPASERGGGARSLWNKRLPFSEDLNSDFLKHLHHVRESKLDGHSVLTQFHGIDLILNRKGDSKGGHDDNVNALRVNFVITEGGEGVSRLGFSPVKDLQSVESRTNYWDTRARGYVQRKHGELVAFVDMLVEGDRTKFEDDLRMYHFVPPNEVNSFTFTIDISCGPISFEDMIGLLTGRKQPDA